MDNYLVFKLPTMKKILFTFRNALMAFLILGAASAQAQSTLNVAGNSAKINGMTFDYSIGEMTLVSTERNANIIVTQGLLQPTSVSASGNTGDGISGIKLDDIKVYPNPTDRELNISTLLEKEAAVGYELFDASGKVILRDQRQYAAGQLLITLDLSTLAAGNYYLSLDIAGAQKFSFKVQKMR
jgi:hypothetical protein